MHAMSTSDRRPPVSAARASEDQRETQLVAAIASRDAQAFEAFYRIYRRKLARFVMRTLGRSEEIDEIVNDVMLVVWNKATEFNGTSRVSTWVFGIAFNKARKHFTVGASLEQALPLDGDADATFSSSQWQATLERQDLLDKALAGLSPDHRAVVELTYFHGMHYREIGEIMGCPENTVKTRMFNARRNLCAIVERLRK